MNARTRPRDVCMCYGTRVKQLCKVFTPEQPADYIKHHRGLRNYMWQSRVEIEYYSIAYFDRVIVFKAPYLRTSFKGGAQT